MRRLALGFFSPNPDRLTRINRMFFKFDSRLVCRHIAFQHIYSLLFSTDRPPGRALEVAALREALEALHDRQEEWRVQDDPDTLYTFVENSIIKPIIHILYMLIKNTNKHPGIRNHNIHYKTAGLKTTVFVLYESYVKLKHIHTKLYRKLCFVLSRSVKDCDSRDRSCEV